MVWARARRLLAGIAIGIAGWTLGAQAGSASDITVAVAANFTGPAKAIAKTFEKETGNRVRLSFGATGGLFAQIAQGAPFDIFLAADRVRPEKAVEQGLAVKGSLFTYALGKLVLYAPDKTLGDGAKVLAGGSFGKLAVADPKAAPYGAAGVATLKALKLYDGLSDKLIYGANVTQTLQFVQTGNAELGFVALSQVRAENKAHFWVVPEQLYPPIEQGAVLLKPGAQSKAAKAFLDFLKGPEGHRMIEDAGYGVVGKSALLNTRWAAGEKPLKDCGS